ncbi:hypothetical protein K437DRAFT_192922 [Tilletiaria anomala UBC 951]|uniref:Uncharacterized protein n=1 Tax=Tilletiaria anomala (strain ATCC 24038 / CBS 436.72 / UBC 951) TaxID=1037660 RepID=A0A066VEY2_TILAU|nr:uncharacterized protein K437DRAFT_192922 [Tilletiaria anomala UBC 951]KDN40026.1 hypothetical protein K437DRAFT_192922 [Tilletiaria anomala UBC 951]
MWCGSRLRDSEKHNETAGKSSTRLDSHVPASPISSIISFCFTVTLKPFRDGIAAKLSAILKSSSRRLTRASDNASYTQLRPSRRIAYGAACIGSTALSQGLCFLLCIPPNACSTSSSAQASLAEAKTAKRKLVSRCNSKFQNRSNVHALHIDDCDTQGLRSGGRGVGHSVALHPLEGEDQG